MEIQSGILIACIDLDLRVRVSPRGGELGDFERILWSVGEQEPPGCEYLNGGRIVKGERMNRRRCMSTKIRPTTGI